MPLIATTVVVDERRVRSEIAAVTEDEYALWLENDKPLEVTRLIPALFLNDYVVQQKGVQIKDLDKASKGIAETGDKYTFESVYSKFVAVEYAKQTLLRFNLDYQDFIEAYCNYLKTL